MKKALKTIFLSLLVGSALVACDYAKHTRQTGLDEKISREDLKKMQCNLDGVTMNCLDFAIAGEDLYSQKCSRCHESIEISEVKGLTKQNIDDAILEVTKMNQFSGLSEDQRQAIALALSL